MAIEHKNISENGLHEPKGVSLAPAKRVYVSDGLGSGSWAVVDADTLRGSLNNSTPAGRRVETDGSGGFIAQPAPANSYGTLNLTDNTTPQSITAAVDSTLKTDSDYQPITVAFSNESLRNMSSGTNSLTMGITGLYLIDFWANIITNTGNSTVGIKFVVNGTTFVPRAPKQRHATSGELYNLSANGIHNFTAGDEVTLYIASTATANITIESMTFQMVYLGTF